MPQPLRVMSYNILFGGAGKHGDRLQSIADVINEVRPDVLALNECLGFLENGAARRDELCRLVGMEGVIAETPSGNHVGLLYREPWSPTEVLTLGLPMHHGLVRAKFQTAASREISVLATHLNPYSSLSRMAEAQVVLSRITPNADAIVMGDLNSLPAGSSHQIHVHRLLDLQMQPDTEVARYFAAAGLMDVLAQHHVIAPTYPTPLDPKPDEFGDGVRLDFILASRALARQCTSADVLDTPLAQRASDHRPTVAQFILR